MHERYSAWNRALIEEYFPPIGNKGRLAYLPVDDDELRALASDYQLCSPDAAVAEFVAAVKAALGVLPRVVPNAGDGRSVAD